MAKRLLKKLSEIEIDKKRMKLLEFLNKNRYQYSVKFNQVVIYETALESGCDYDWSHPKAYVYKDDEDEFEIN